MNKMTNMLFFSQGNDVELELFAQNYTNRYKDIYEKLGVENFSIIKAGDGYLRNMEIRDEVFGNSPVVVFSNSIYFLTNDFFWNEENDYPNIYLINPENPRMIRNIQSMTEKEIRRPHNVARMFLAGAFSFENVHFYEEYL